LNSGLRLPTLKRRCCLLLLLLLLVPEGLVRGASLAVRAGLSALAGTTATPVPAERHRQHDRAGEKEMYLSSSNSSFSTASCLRKLQQQQQQQRWARKP
jgi:hypothetical protein